MGWTERLLLATAIFGCLIGCNASAPYSTPGALYVEFVVAGASPYVGPNETTEIRDGRVVGHRPLGFVVARDRPDRWLVDSSAPVCSGRGSYRTYRLSPDGSRTLCSEGEDLRVFETTHPQTARVVVKGFEENASQTSFAWLDNSRFIALVLDKSCPYAHLYDFYPTRVVTFDLSGRRLSTGPCAFGIVTGEHRIALLGEGPNGLRFFVWQLIHDDVRFYNDGYDRFHSTWSVDGGNTWHDGAPLTFDGNDRLLYYEPLGDVVKSEDGQTVFQNALSVQWSR